MENDKEGLVLQEVTTPPANVALTPCRDSLGFKSIKKKIIKEINEGLGVWSCDANLTHWCIWSGVSRRPRHYFRKCAVETR